MLQLCLISENSSILGITWFVSIKWHWSVGSSFQKFIHVFDENTLSVSAGLGGERQMIPHEITSTLDCFHMELDLHWAQRVISCGIICPSHRTKPAVTVFFHGGKKCTTHVISLGFWFHLEFFFPRYGEWHIKWLRNFSTTNIFCQKLNSIWHNKNISKLIPSGSTMFPNKFHLVKHNKQWISLFLCPVQLFFF